MKNLLEKLAQREDLTANEMDAIMETIATGGADPILIAVFLSLLRAKGETPLEVQTLVNVMLRHARIVSLPDDTKTLDIVGTGGDGANTVNLSTSAAILAAACGANVAKHGNRSVSSRSGSADVLEVMGVPMLEPQHIAECIHEANIAFMYAPHFHPAMKHVAPVRKSMGIRTVFNVLGPLINPAKCKTTVIGVYTPALLDTFGEVLHLMGVDHALVVHCAGLDELNSIGDADIVEVTPQGCRRYKLTPEDLNIPRCTLEELKGGDAEENCRILRKVFQGGENCENAIGNTIAYNAGAGLYVYGLADSIKSGYEIAKSALKAGKALETLDRWSQSNFARMINYNQEEFFSLLRKLPGSAFDGNGPRRALAMAVFATIITAGNHIYTIVFIQTKTSLACSYTLSVFNVFLGLLISFRLNSAFSQWRSGVVAMGSVGDAARGILSSTVSFLDLSIDGEEKLRFMSEIRRLVCLYVSILVQDARGCAQDDIQSFIECNLLADTEAEEMRRCGVICNVKPFLRGRNATIAEVNPSKLRSSIVELWIRRLIQIGHRRNWFGMPQSSAINGYVSTLVSLYSTIYNIANIPIPFNYAHFLVLVTTIYLAMYTFVIVQTSNYFTPLWVFGWGFIIFSADDLAREIECPFGTDPNDIDLENRIIRIEEELDVVLRSAYFHEATLRAEMMMAHSSNHTHSTESPSVCVDSLPLSELSEHLIEPNPTELPMPAAPLLRLMLTQSVSEKDMLSNGSTQNITETIPLVPSNDTNNEGGYGSVSSVRDAVWL